MDTEMIHSFMKQTYIPKGNEQTPKRTVQAETLSAVTSKVELQVDYNNKNFVNSIPVGKADF